MNPIIQPTETIQPLRHEQVTETRDYMAIYSDGVRYDTITAIRQTSFNNQGQRIYEVSVDPDEKVFYKIPYGFDVPYKHEDKSINCMITHAKFNQ